MEYLRVERIVDMVEAFRIAMGESKMPVEWIEMLSESDTERSSWQYSEFRREV